MVTCSGASWGDPGHGSAMAGGEEQSAPVKRAARVRERARGGGGMEGELTARSMSSSVVSGRRRRRRIDRGDLRWPATETAMVAALQRVRDLVARWRGRGGRGGARRHSEGSRGRRWPRRYGGAAAAALGLEREREQKRGKSSGERGVRPGDRGGTEKKQRGVALAG